MSFDNTNKRFSPFEFDDPNRKQMKTLGKLPKIDEVPLNVYSFLDKTFNDVTATPNSTASSHDSQPYLSLRVRLNSECTVGENLTDTTVRDLPVFKNLEFSNLSNAVFQDSNQIIFDRTFIDSQGEQISLEAEPKAQYEIRDSLSGHEEYFEVNEMNQFQGENGHFSEQSIDSIGLAFGGKQLQYTKRNLENLDIFLFKGTIEPEAQNSFMNQSKTLQPFQLDDTLNNRISTVLEISHFTNSLKTTFQYSNSNDINIRITPERKKKTRQQNFQLASTQLNNSHMSNPIFPYSYPTSYPPFSAYEPFDRHRLIGDVEDIQATQARARITRERETGGAGAGDELGLQGQFRIFGHQSNFDDENGQNFFPQEPPNTENSESNFSSEDSYISRSSENSKRVGKKAKTTRPTKNVITIARGIWNMFEMNKDPGRFDVSDICKKSGVKLTDVHEYLEKYLNKCDSFGKLTEIISEDEDAEKTVNPMTLKEDVLKIAGRVIVKKFFDEGHFERWVEDLYSPGSNPGKGKKKDIDQRTIEIKKNEFLEKKAELREKFLNPKKYARK